MTTLSQAAAEARSILSLGRDTDYDLIIIGGGITGAGIFHLAASQGAKVLLLEQQDFAWGTSSRSSKMIHGGLRYLARGQWRMTRNAARERESMLAELPGLVDLMPYLMLHKKGDFPSAAIFHRVLSVYDKLAGSQYHKPLSMDKARSWLSELSFNGVNGVSLFADGVTDDARLVLRSLQDGVLAGGQALNYAKVKGFIEGEGRILGAEISLDGSDISHRLKAKCVINATGCWAGELHPLVQGGLRPLRGSHLLLPFERLPVSACITFYHPQDGRPVYIYPWQGCSVMGTTDLDHRGDLDKEPSITQEEVDYLLGLARHYFPNQEIGETDVVSCWSGIRPIFSESTDKAPSKESREHIICAKPGLISVSGGKLTSYHLMAKETLEQVREQLPELFIDLKKARFSQASQGDAEKHLTGYFGHFAPQISAMNNSDMIGISRCQWRELEWSVANECVVHLDDLLLRRTRLALLLGIDIGHYREDILLLCCRHLGWSSMNADKEWTRFEQIFNLSYQLPSRQMQKCL